MAELLLDKVVDKNLLVSLQLESNLHGVNSNHICCLSRIIQNKTKHRFPLP